MQTVVLVRTTKHRRQGEKMFDIQNYGSFIIAIILFQIIPGAGTITTLNATARNGVGVGMSAVCGTLLGDFVYMLAGVALIGFGVKLAFNNR
jgi:threonine/homoserine/homoserine lactone efflux protein